MKLKKTMKKNLMTYHKELVTYREQLDKERDEESYREYLESLNEYCHMRYLPYWGYHYPDWKIQYAWIRESDGDYFGIHTVDDIEINPEWLDQWEDQTKKPEVEPIYETPTMKDK